jgi:hypothetical protein
VQAPVNTTPIISFKLLTPCKDRQPRSQPEKLAKNYEKLDFEAKKEEE